MDRIYNSIQHMSQYYTSMAYLLTSVLPTLSKEMIFAPKLTVLLDLPLWPSD